MNIQHLFVGNLSVEFLDADAADPLKVADHLTKLRHRQSGLESDAGDREENGQQLINDGGIGIDLSFREIGRVDLLVASLVEDLREVLLWELA